MARVHLSRLPGDRVQVVDGERRVGLDLTALPSYVSGREAVDPPRWVWDDTARWYTPLLAAGVRVERCTEDAKGRQVGQELAVLLAQRPWGRRVGLYR